MHNCAYNPQWDTTKSRANLVKHGVDFADAVTVFEDPFALTRPDSDARGEPRFVTLGSDGFGRLLVVVFAERGPNIRIISARQASSKECKSYEG